MTSGFLAAAQRYCGLTASHSSTVGCFRALGSSAAGSWCGYGWQPPLRGPKSSTFSCWTKASSSNPGALSFGAVRSIIAIAGGFGSLRSLRIGSCCCWYAEWYWARGFVCSLHHSISKLALAALDFAWFGLLVLIICASSTNYCFSFLFRMVCLCRTLS